VVRVRKDARRELPVLHPDSLVHKLAIKPDSPFYGWLEREIAHRFDVACCTSAEQFRRETRAITRAGQIKAPGERHEKDDRHRIDDRSRYVLGWSNEAKLATLQAKQRLLQALLAETGARIAGLQSRTFAAGCRTASMPRTRLDERRRPAGTGAAAVGQGAAARWPGRRRRAVPPAAGAAESVVRRAVGAVRRGSCLVARVAGGEGLSHRDAGSAASGHRPQCRAGRSLGRFAGDALHLIGKGSEARRFAALATATRERAPVLVPWLQANALRALALADRWPRLLDIVQWLQARPRPGVYLRQVDLPGVHSKYIEEHAAVLSELFDLVLPADAIDSSVTGAANLARRYGFRAKPVRVRFRLLDPQRSLLGTSVAEDVTVDHGTFALLAPAVSRVFITENEVNFLAFPPVADAMVVFGAGYGFDMLAAVRWLQQRTIHYWGDIDTHGFAILDQLRGHFPHVESFLMDRATLLAHREQWTDEPQPVLRELSRLAASERALFDELRWQRLEDMHVRLEQERIGFGRLVQVLASLVNACPKTGECKAAMGR
jgi:hypothetical protein